MRNSIATFKTKAGIFVQDRYVPLIEAFINLGASIILVKYLGLVGIFIGTTISTLSIVFWNVPRLVYKHVFNKSVKIYFIKYFIYAILTIFTGYVTTNICNMIVTNTGFIYLVIKGIICITIPNLIFIAIFYKTEEFNYLLSALKPFLFKFNKMYTVKVEE